MSWSNNIILAFENHRLVVGGGMTLPKDRVPYSAIVDRPPLMLPDGARMIVWTIVNGI